MTAENEQVIQLFKRYLHSVLVSHDIEDALSCTADDVIGIGMGSQGVVCNKADVARIMGDNKQVGAGSVTLDYETIQMRCYGGQYATVCGVLKIQNHQGGRVVESSMGQLMNLRLENGRWLVYTLQATPLFNAIEEMEAYPIRFAENVLETYRRQEQMARNAHNDSVGIYHVNFTKGCFEDCFLKADFLVRVKAGEPYEKVIIDAARQHLAEADRYQFIRQFSLGNILQAYAGGQTEISLEYQMLPFASSPLWVKTLIKLYTDNQDDNLKGYLYVMDIDKDKRAKLELESKAALDPLTGLLNKVSAEGEIARKLRRVSPANPGAFFMMDLDYFKLINDNFGHKEGDRILQEASRCIVRLLGKDDLAGRLGGDEFCLYFASGRNRENITQKAEALCDMLRHLQFASGAKTTCSLGVVFFSAIGLQFDDVYQMADRALYLQKEKGRNGFTVFEPEQA